MTSLPFQNGSKIPSAESDKINYVAIKSHRILTRNDAVKTTLEITFDIKDTGIIYEPGDAISILCPNPDDEVNLLLRRLGINDKMADANCELSLIPNTAKKTAKIPDFAPVKSTLRYLLTTSFDIRTPPKKVITL